MEKQKLYDLIDKVIGKQGPLRVPAYWMRNVLVGIVNWVEVLLRTRDDVIDKKFSEFKNYLSTKIGVPMEYTYDELKELRGAGKLIPGQKYILTDYKCKVSALLHSSSSTLSVDTATLSGSLIILEAQSTYNFSIHASMIVPDESKVYDIDYHFDRLPDYEWCPSWIELQTLVKNEHESFNYVSAELIESSVYPIYKLFFQSVENSQMFYMRASSSPLEKKYDINDTFITLYDTNGKIQHSFSLEIEKCKDDFKGFISRMVDPSENIDVPFDFLSIVMSYTILREDVVHWETSGKLFRPYSEYIYHNIRIACPTRFISGYANFRFPFIRLEYNCSNIDIRNSLFVSLNQSSVMKNITIDNSDHIIIMRSSNIVIRDCSQVEMRDNEGIRISNCDKVDAYNCATGSIIVDTQNASVAGGGRYIDVRIGDFSTIEDYDYDVVGIYVELRIVRRDKNNHICYFAGYEPAILIDSGDGTKFLADDGTYKFVETNPFEIPSGGVLPETGKTGKIYLIPASETGENNLMYEYVWINESWEKLGEFVPDVDLTEYYTKSEVDNKNSALKTELTKTIGNVQTSVTNLEDSKLDKETATNTLATKEEVARKQNILVSGTNIKTINGENILGLGDIVIDTSVLNSTGTHSGKAMSQKATTDVLNAEINRATTKENELEGRIFAHESITQDAYDTAEYAETIAIDSNERSQSAETTASAAMAAVRTLEGLGNTDTAQTTLANTVAQIEQNSSDIKVLQEMFVLISEEAYEELEVKDPTKIYLMYEE